MSATSLIRLLAAAAFAAAPLSAAPSLRALAWDEEVAARKLGLVAAGKVVEITGLHPQRRTAPLPAKGTGPFAVRALDKGTTADGKPVERPCPVPETMQFPLLLILPDDSHPAGVRLLVVDDNPHNFRWGAYRFLNATPKELVVQMESRALRVPAGWTPVELDLGGQTRGFGARIFLPDVPDRPLYSAVWEYDTNVRTLVFLVPGTDPRLGPVAFKAVPESRITFELDQRAQVR